MSLELRTFVRLLKQKDLKGAREWLDQRRSGLNPPDEFWKGYFLALQGMISAIETGAELSLIKRLLDGGYGREDIEKLIDQMRERLSPGFRPRDEQGFSTAWMEVLQEFLEKMNRHRSPDHEAPPPPTDPSQPIDRLGS
jgi:hypothetical protein